MRQNECGPGLIGAVREVVAAIPFAPEEDVSEMTGEPTVEIGSESPSVAKNGLSRGDPSQYNGSEGISHFLSLTRKNPLLSAEEEVALSKDIEAGLFAEHVLKARRGRTVVDPEKAKGDEVLDLGKIAASDDELRQLVEIGLEAKERMINSNIKLVASIARTGIQATTYSLEDRIQEGMFGLIRAVEKFDYTKGYKFSTYATWWLKQQIRRGEAYSASSVKLPIRFAEAMSALFATRNKLLNSLDRDPTLVELAAALGVPEEDVNEMMFWNGSMVSLDQPMGPDTDRTLGDLYSDSAPAGAGDAVFVLEIIEDLMKELTEKEKEVVGRHFGLGGRAPEVFKNIALTHNLTQERIRQIQAGAITKMVKAASQMGLRLEDIFV